MQNTGCIVRKRNVSRSTQRGLLKGEETVSQLCPAGTPAGECAPVMSVHEEKKKKKRMETRYKHSSDLAQSLGQGYDRGWENERGFQRAVQGVSF